MLGAVFRACGIGATLQIEQFHFSKLHRAAFRLQADIPRAQGRPHFVKPRGLQKAAEVFGRLPYFRVAVGDNGPPIYHVAQQRIAIHLYLQSHPLIAVEGGRLGVHAVLHHGFSLHLYVGAGRTEIARRPQCRRQSAQHLHFQRHRKRLRYRHAFRRLCMHHDAAIAIGP